MSAVDVAVVGYRPGPETARLLAEVNAITRRPHTVNYFDNTGNPKNLSAAWNDLARQGSGTFIAFLNPDIVISPGWDDRMAACLEGHPEVGAVLPSGVGGNGVFRLVNGVTYPGRYSNPPTPDEMGAMAAWSADKAGHYVFSATDPAPFWAVMMRRADWEALKGFDERLRFYGQDHDMQHRLRRRGLQTVMLLSCPVFNYGSLPTRRAREAGDFDVNEEYHANGRVYPLLRDGRLPLWENLSDAERAAVRGNPAYAISRLR